MLISLFSNALDPDSNTFRLKAEIFCHTIILPWVHQTIV